MSRESRPLGEDIRTAWGRFHDVYEPLRPELYRYCRHLTRSAWDAEDMAQDTMARAYVTLGCMVEPPPNPRAWLFRVASNLWLNERRRTRAAVRLEESNASNPFPEPRGAREAAGTLLGQLSPQERASVVLKDVFDLSLDEIAAALSTSPGAIKTALHRGRAKLVAPEPEEPAEVPAGVLDAFCDAFNTRDLNRLTALLLDSATMEFPGILVEYGADALRAGSLQNTLFGCPDGRYVVTEARRSEHRVYRGESILLWWLGDEVDAVVRVSVQDDHIVGLRNYRHAPELLTEICSELGVPFRTHGYRPQLENVS